MKSRKKLTDNSMRNDKHVETMYFYVKPLLKIVQLEKWFIVLLKYNKPIPFIFLKSANNVKHFFLNPKIVLLKIVYFSEYNSIVNYWIDNMSDF